MTAVIQRASGSKHCSLVATAAQSTIHSASEHKKTRCDSHNGPGDGGNLNMSQLLGTYQPHIWCHPIGTELPYTIEGFHVAQMSPMGPVLSSSTGDGDQPKGLMTSEISPGFLFGCSVADVDPGSTLQGLTAPEGGRLLRPREELRPSRAMRHR